METGRVVFGLVALGVMALMLTGKGSYFNPSRYSNTSNIGRFTTTGNPNQYAGFFGAGSSTLEEEVIPMAGFFGAGSSKLEDPPLPGRYDNARPSAGFLSTIGRPTQEDFYGPERYIPWEQRG